MNNVQSPKSMLNFTNFSTNIIDKKLNYILPEIPNELGVPEYTQNTLQTKSVIEQMFCKKLNSLSQSVLSAKNF